MYGLYFITLQRSGTRPVTKPLRSIRPEHRGTFHTQFWLGTICPSTHPSICPSMYILVSFCGRLQLLRGHLRGRGNGIAIGISHIPMVSARLFPRSDNRVRAGRIVFMTLCPKQILRLGFLFRPNFGIFKGGGCNQRTAWSFSEQMDEQDLGHWNFIQRCLPPWSQNWFSIFFVYHVRLGVVPFFGTGNFFRKTFGPKKFLRDKFGYNPP